ncbi:MAG TPA: BMP family ABC transporter substrate-binding protein [Gaiellaceae bacterium]
MAAVALAGSFGVAKAPAAGEAKYGVALVSDVAGFNDNGFNKNQLAGLNRAKSKLGIAAFPIVSHSSGDYSNNYHTAVVTDKAKLVIAAGFLLGPTVKQYAKANPAVKFAITDDTVSDIGGRKNEEGITYATQEGGCLVGVLAAEMAKSLNKNKAGTIGVVGGFEIPPVDAYIAGYKYCANKAVPGTKILVQYALSFDEPSKCSTVATNELGQHATVIFQVAGSCGDGALTTAGSAGKWGIGVDADEYKVSPGHILTSALKKTDVGVYDTIQGAVKGTFKGGKNLLFNLKNSGVGVGKINPAVKSSWKSLMNSYKSKIIAGTLKPPAACKNNKC